jgi:hypothetical protein
MVIQATIIILLILAALIAGGVISEALQIKKRLVRLLDNAVEAERAYRSQRDELEALRSQRKTEEREHNALVIELDAIRQKRHTHATTLMIEDLQAVMSDLSIELNQSMTFLQARLAQSQKILNDGRPGPYAYKPLPSGDRPQRPGQIKLWH